MHELAATQELVRMVLARSASPREVVVELGGLTTYKPEPLRFYFDVLRKEHPSLAGASLTIEEVPGVIRCDECGKQSVVEASYLLVCPACDSVRTTIIKGKDFNLVRIVQ